MSKTKEIATVIINRLELLNDQPSSINVVLPFDYKNLADDFIDLYFNDNSKASVIYYSGKILSLIEAIEKRSFLIFENIKSFNSWAIKEIERNVWIEDELISPVDFVNSQSSTKILVTDKIRAEWFELVQVELDYYKNSIEEMPISKSSLIREEKAEIQRFNITEEQSRSLFYLTITGAHKNGQLISKKSNGKEDAFFKALSTPLAFLKKRENVKFIFDCENGLVSFVLKWMELNGIVSQSFTTIERLGVFYSGKSSSKPITQNSLSNAKNSMEKRLGLTFDAFISKQRRQNKIDNLDEDSSIINICESLNRELRSICS
jgi:hypothetical protein